MRPLPFVWPYAIVFWAVFIWAFVPEFGVIKRAKKTGNPTDAKSLHVIMFGLQIASFGAFVVAFIPAFQIPAYRVGVFLTGVMLMVSGSLLRRHCWRMLGTSFTGDVRARADQEVVSRGAYGIVRHPSYTAAILLNAGIGVALGSWLSTLFLVAASFAVYTYRMNVEERALLAAIGEPYAQFMRTRKRVIPFIY